MGDNLFLKQRCTAALRKHWGHREFRSRQYDAIEAILNGRDVFVSMATGSGKSLCFQIPPLIQGKLAIVVAPLISLMQDQVLGLQTRGIKAAYTGSATDAISFEEVFNDPDYRVIYVTPEGIMLKETGYTMCHDIIPRLYAANRIGLIAIDEAHCVSEWGHDFRVAYAAVCHLRAQGCPNVPIMALTATATPIVRNDTVRMMQLRNPLVIVESLFKDNIQLAVLPRGISTGALQPYFPRANTPTIVYVRRKAEAEALCEEIRAWGEPSVDFYHAGRSHEDRKDVHTRFLHDELNVVVATIAFGMGIDKPDVRRVIHWGMPNSLESYLQEAGRAGRDRMTSQCLLFSNPYGDQVNNLMITECDGDLLAMRLTASLRCMAEYVVNRTECRFQNLLSHFGEHMADPCMVCDICTDTLPPLEDEEEWGYEVYLLLKAIQLSGERFGKGKILGILRGSKSKEIIGSGLHLSCREVYGLGETLPAYVWEQLISHLVVQLERDAYIQNVPHYMEQRKKSYFSLGVGPLGMQFINRPPQDRSLKLRLAHNRNDAGESTHTAVPDNNSLLNGAVTDDDSLQAYTALSKWRRATANTEQIPPYMILDETVMQLIAILRPTSREHLASLELPGLSRQRITHYGDSMTKAIAEFAGENPNVPVNLVGAERPAAMLAGENRRAIDGLTPKQRQVYTSFQSARSTINEIALLEHIKPSTVEAYLAKAYVSGLPLDLTQFGITARMVDGVKNFPQLPAAQIVNVFKNNGHPLKYGQLNVIKTMLRQLETNDLTAKDMIRQSTRLPLPRNPPLNRTASLPVGGGRMNPAQADWDPAPVGSPGTRQSRSHPSVREQFTGTGRARSSRSTASRVLPSGAGPCRTQTPSTVTPTGTLKRTATQPATGKVVGRRKFGSTASGSASGSGTATKVVGGRKFGTATTTTTTTAPSQGAGSSGGPARAVRMRGRARARIGAASVKQEGISVKQEGGAPPCKEDKGKGRLK